MDVHRRADVSGGGRPTPPHGRRYWRAAAACAALSLVAGCGSPGGGAPEAGDDAGAGGQQEYMLAGQGQRKADSLEAYIDQILSYPETSETASEILERAKAEGGVSVSDYEQTWANYRYCMIERGYVGLELRKYPNGVYAEPAHYRGTDAQERQYDKDQRVCMADVGPVAEVFNMQQGNPNLYSNKSEAIVDCIRRSGVVGNEYTVQQYVEDRMQSDPDDASIDMKSMEVRGCHVANNTYITYAEDELEYLWGPPS